MEEQNICQLCGNKGAEIDLQSIPCALPSFLPKMGKVHLNCLETEVNKNIRGIDDYRFTFLFCCNFIIWIITGLYLWFVSDLILPLLLGLFFIWLIPFLYFIIPYSRVRPVLKWIKTMAEKMSETEKEIEAISFASVENHKKDHYSFIDLNVERNKIYNWMKTKPEYSLLLKKLKRIRNIESIQMINALIFFFGVFISSTFNNIPLLIIMIISAVLSLIFAIVLFQMDIKHLRKMYEEYRLEKMK